MILILLALASAAPTCPTGTQPARAHGKPVCVPAKVAAPPVDPYALRLPLRQFTGKHVWRNNYPDKPIDRYVVEGVAATCSTTCVVIGRASTGNIVRDASFTRARPAQKATDIDAGIRIGGGKGQVATDGVLIERVRSFGWQMVPVKGYANGDGLTINRDVGTVTVRYSTFEDNADGGIDSKAAMLRVEHVRTARNGHYGLRVWLGADIDDLTCDSDAWGCIEAGPEARVTVRFVRMIGDQELATTKKGAIVTFEVCPDLTRWTGKALLKGAGKVTFPAGCVVP